MRLQPERSSCIKADFIAALDPTTYAITAPTRLVDDSEGVGLALTPTGFAVCGAANTATRSSSPGGSPSLFAVINAGSTTGLAQRS
jgi:hypothetical protein